MPSPDNARRAHGVGVAIERTQLAWNRSGLAVLLCISVLLRRLWPLNRAGTVIALALIVGGALVWSLGLQGGARKARRIPSAPMGETTARLLSLGAVVLAAAGFVLGFFPPR